MSWQDDMGAVLRALINDYADPPRYDDDRLEELLVVAAKLVLAELTFPVEYAADVGNTDIAPDPTEGSSRDDAFANLVALKAACLIDRGEHRNSLARGALFKDGAVAVDFRDSLKGYAELLKQGWCAVYDQAKLDYRSGQVEGGIGAAVLSPFRLWLGYDRPPYQNRR